jgi:hypothetical protein
VDASQNDSTQGPNGATGTASLDISDNVVSLQGNSGVSIQLLAQTWTSGSGGSSDALNTANLTFSGNTFTGGGLSILDLGDVMGGGATFDLVDGQLSIAGSPGNAFSGFYAFDGTPQNNLFIIGPGDDANGIYIYDGGGSTGSFIIDFSGFGPGLSSFAQVEADATGLGGVTSIQTPDGGSVILPDVTPSELTAAEFEFDPASTTVSPLAGQSLDLSAALGTSSPLSVTIDGPGTVTLTGVATVPTVVISGGGTLLLQGGTLNTDPITVDASGNISGYGTLTGDETINGTATAAGGTLDLTGNIGGSGTLTLDAGAALQLEGTVAATESVIFTGGSQSLILGVSADVMAPVSGFAAGDFIALEGQLVTSAVYDASTDQLAINSSSGPTLVLGLVGTYQPSQFGIANGVVDLDGPLCFLAATHILTPTGEVPVERLEVGDSVSTSGGWTRRIAWIGAGRVLATRGSRTIATPVIVRKGALADNVPNRDLHVTKAHSLFLDDVLIPVEFLVNHRSILWDDHAQEVTLYHIELDSHDVLLANGAPAESYRDDGNRWLFQNANSGWGLRPQKAYAPVMTSGPVVDAVWRRLLDRTGPRPGLPTTEDPDLHLLVDGHRVDATSRSDAWHTFRLAARSVTVRIVSRSGVPQEIGLARDPRSLGVAVRQILVRQGLRVRTTEATDPRLAAGFHAFEADNDFRWTDGDAPLPAILFEGFGGPMEVVLHIGCTTRYPLHDGPARAEAA